MTCAYIFGIIALVGLPQAIQQATSGGFHPLPIVQWVAQTFLQLVLLSVIIVGQNIQAEAGDARAAKTFEDAESTNVCVKESLDRLDENTTGGIGTLNAKLDQLLAAQGGRKPSGKV